MNRFSDEGIDMHEVEISDEKQLLVLPEWMGERSLIRSKIQINLMKHPFVVRGIILPC